MYSSVTGFFLLNIMSERTISFVVCINSSFVFIPLYNMPQFFVHFNDNGHLSSFQFQAFINKAAGSLLAFLKTFLTMSFGEWLPSFLFSVYPRIKSLNHREVIYLNFRDSAI